MNFITPEELEDFIGKYTEEGDTKAQSFCNSAMEYVKNYLKYDPEQKQYTTVIKGDNGKLAVLEASPVSSISAFKIDGETHNVLELEIINENYIGLVNESCFLAGHRYEITYTAGFSTVPAIIKTTALQIASLLWESAGGNLAVSSTSFVDSGSRVFNNFKADRFLDQIEHYKRVF